MTHKIWISTGGTGGHLFPAMALAAELQQRAPAVNIFFVGGGLKSSRYFDSSRYPYMEIPCGSFVHKNPLALLRSMRDISRGIWRSHRLLSMQRPDLLVGFGSFFSFPPLVAARLARIPLVLHAADAKPGRVIRLLSHQAELTVLQFAEASRYLHGASAVAKMPLRPGLRKGLVSRALACAALGLDAEKSIVLVFGGSQGAHRLNQLVSEAMVLCPELNVQLLHYTGHPHSAESLSTYYCMHQIPACVKAFESRMDLAWAAADLAITRSGASTVAELSEFEVPAILVPYPYAKDQHQDANADVMATRGGGMKIPERELTSSLLAEQLTYLFSHQGKALATMRKALAMAKATRPDVSLGDLVLATLQRRDISASR